MQKKLKMVFVLPAGGIVATGGFRIIAGYAETLKARGHDVTLMAPSFLQSITGTPKQRLREWIKRFFRRPKSESADIPFITNKDIKVIISSRQNRLDPEDFPDADIYIGSWWETMEWLEGIPPSASKLHFVQGYEAFSFLPLDRVHAVYASPVDKIVVSEWLQSKLAHDYGVQSVLVENVVDCDELARDNRKKNSQMTVGFLHSITESKNSPMAIEACRLLRARFPDLRVVAFGGNAPKAAEKFPAWIDLSIRPSVEEIATIYGACDAWIFSSDEEGFGLPILEAMAAGTPVVATPAGAAPQLVNKENGALVGRDAQELADAVARILLLQPDEWKKMSRAAEETARRRSWDDAADEFEVVLYDIVNRRGEFIKN